MDFWPYAYVFIYSFIYLCSYVNWSYKTHSASPGIRWFPIDSPFIQRTCPHPKTSRKFEGGPLELAAKVAIGLGQLIGSWHRPLRHNGSHVPHRHQPAELPATWVAAGQFCQRLCWWNPNFWSCSSPGLTRFNKVSGFLAQEGYSWRDPADLGERCGNLCSRCLQKLLCQDSEFVWQFDHHV